MSDLRDALNFKASDRGRVSLLVHSRRSGELRNVWVNLEYRAGYAPQADAAPELEVAPEPEFLPDPGLRSDEDAIRHWYRTYLGRETNRGDISTWKDAFSRGSPREDLHVGILSSPEFYELANYDDRTLIELLFQRVAGREADSQQVDQWLDRLADLGGDRNLLVREFLDVELGGVPAN